MAPTKTLYGRGSVQEIERGKKYRIEVSCGKDPKTGKYRRVRETFRGTRRQAEMRCEEIRREQEERLNKELARADHAGMADTDTYAAVSERFISGRIANGHRGKPYRRETVVGMRNAERHLVSRIGDMQIAKVDHILIEELLTSMRKDGVGENTLVKVYRQLRQVLDYAVRVGIIPDNPCAKLDPNIVPVEPKGRREALPVDEMKRLARLCTGPDTDGKRMAVFIALSCGLRFGECMGLTWNHVDLDSEPARLQVVQQHNRFGELTGPKTEAGARMVPLDYLTQGVLSAWKVRQADLLAQLGIGQDGSTPVCTNERGDFNNTSSYGRWWRRFCVANGFGRWEDDEGRPIVQLPIGTPAGYGIVAEYRDAEGWPCDVDGRRYSRSYPKPKFKRHYSGLVFHQLRHSHFTQRVAQGTDLKSVQYLGGWSTASVLLNTYAHADQRKILESASFMPDLLGDAVGASGAYPKTIYPRFAQNKRSQTLASL